MNIIVNLLCDAADVVHTYAREVCAVLLVIALFAGGNYLLSSARLSQDSQRAALNEFTQPQSPSTSAPAPQSCAWLKTDGTNTACVSADAPR